MSNLLSNLRQYRFQKTNSEKETTGHSSTIDNGIAPGRKRIKINDTDSGSENEPSPKKTTQLTPREKELILIETVKAFPECNVLQVKETLVRYHWNKDKTIEAIKNNPLKKRKVETNKLLNPTLPVNHLAKTANGHSSISFQQRPPMLKTHQKPKDKKDSDYSDESDNDNHKPNENVFNCDEDSDVERSDYMTKDRRAVFDFMNSAKVSELLAIKSCSVKKADTIIELRPFRNWPDLVNRSQNHKHMSTDLLNNCQQLLNRRNNLANIMKKCNRLVKKLEEAVAAGGGLVQQPSNLNPPLKLADYQMVGLNWLVVINQEEMNGILADEMGLGKTIQVIAFLAYLKNTGRAKHSHLIVVPSSTLDNWENELKKWCPELKVEKYYGSLEERKSLRIYWAKGGLAGVDVILTTYRTVSSTPEERKMFRVTPMHYVIFDEAHMLKNMTTQRYEYLIKIKAERRILLTGTPLQNNLLELMSLLCFVMPSLFAHSTEDIKSLFQKNPRASKNEITDETSSFEQTQIEQAKRIMKPFLLRRLKKDVLTSLPKKTETVIKVPMSTSQKEDYANLVKSYSSESGIVKATNEHSGMSIMMDMRKLANHPLLLRYYYTDVKVREIAKRLARDPYYKKTNADHIFDEIAIMSDLQLYQLTQKYSSVKSMNIPKDLILNSGKFRQLDKMLPQLKSEGHRVLIFSQFTMMLDILEKYLDLKGFGYLRLDGQTAVTERQDMIDQYNADNDLFVFLLSTRAGGLGINLTAADTVIIHDIDFNPYNDKQAEDRCHRMGQTRPVHIYKLISEGTIEEAMLMVAKEKLNLEKEVTSSETGDDLEDQEEHKCMIRLLTMALGMDENRAEIMLSSSPVKNRNNHAFEA